MGKSMADVSLRIEDAVNETCPWSGKPITADSLTLYRGHVVGFCKPRAFSGEVGAGSPRENAVKQSIGKFQVHWNRKLSTCRDKFEAAIHPFEKALAKRDVSLIAKGNE